MRSDFLRSSAPYRRSVISKTKAKYRMNFKKLTRGTSIIIFVFHALVCESQINKRLKSLSDSISFENYVEYEDSPNMIKSIDYEFSIISDSLILEYTKTTDNLKYNNSKTSDTVVGKVAIQDLKELYVQTVEDFSGIYTKLIIETLRQKRLIEVTHHSHYELLNYSSMYQFLNIKTQ